MTKENRRRNIALELNRSDECWRAAVGLRNLDLHADAVSRAYYAMLHAAQAVLLTEGLEARSHSGTITLFNLHFVRPGKLPTTTTRTLTQLQGERETADYDASTVYTSEDSEVILERADEFCATCRNYLKDSGWT
ncbi:MAG: HEPN domain-containing protein [Armatimonadetes bacterium]|nr:HEPN domain-containing protein [Armatimonadota bacterium]